MWNRNSQSLSAWKAALASSSHRHRKQSVAQRLPLCWLAWCCALLLVCGCAVPGQQRPAPAAIAQQPPAEVEELRRLPAVDVVPPVAAPEPPRFVPPASVAATAPAAGTMPPPLPAAQQLPVAATRVAYQEEVATPDGRPAPHPPTLTERLRIPPELPGANAPPLMLPPNDRPDLRLAVIDKLFPDLPPMPQLAQPTRPEVIMTLAALEQMALANNPIIAQATADISIALGQTIQAGVYPNPVIGYEADTVGSAGTRNYQGVFGTQVIKTAGKLGLARSVSNVDFMNAQLALRKARIDLLAQVKQNYFAVLVAQESVKINDALVRFTGEAYQIQDDKLKIGGFSAPYEPAQLRSLAVQARTLLVQAQNRNVSAWKQLAVVVGAPGLPMAKLADTAEMPVPRLTYDAALARMLNVHPDISAAQNSQGQARLQRRVERVKPVPDINLYGTFQRDFTTPNVPRTTYNIQFGVPVPIWDRNRGGILSAEANVVRMTEEIRRAEFELTAALADAFERFETNRITLEYYRDQILPDLARAYRGIYERHQQEGEDGGVGFGDIIVAQQNLTVAIAQYITALGMQWTAVADLTQLLQVETIEELNLGFGGAPAGQAPIAPAPR